MYLCICKLPAISLSLLVCRVTLTLPLFLNRTYRYTLYEAGTHQTTDIRGLFVRVPTCLFAYTSAIAALECTTILFVVPA